MGGGPSRDERAATAAAERRAQEQADIQRRLLDQQQQFITAANQPDELENRLRARDLSWLDWEAQPGRDVSTAPLGPALGLYDRAVNQQQGERMGIGALRMGLNASDPNLALKLNQQSKDRQQQEAAGALEDAVRTRSAEVNRSALPLAGFAQDRRMGLASLASGNAANAGGLANSASGQYINSILGRPQRNSFWRTFSQSFGDAAGRVLGGGY